MGQIQTGVYSSRQEQFAAERGHLKPLPPQPWNWGRWERRKVNSNDHVLVCKNHYSVPTQAIGQTVNVRIGEHMVEVFQSSDRERIAVHRRLDGRNRYSTLSEHMPANHKAVADLTDPDRGGALCRAAAPAPEASRPPAHRNIRGADYYAGKDPS